MTRLYKLEYNFYFSYRGDKLVIVHLGFSPPNMQIEEVEIALHRAICLYELL